MKLFSAAIFFNLLFILPAFPQQETSSFVIDSILISGNEITEPYIVLQELTFSPGDTVTIEQLEFNEERIYSLGLFNTVEFKLNEVEKTKLIINVSEAWYIYPLPFVLLKDKDWDKVSYGLDVFIKNFRGRNETLRGRFSLGYDPSISLSYFNPYIIRKESISFGISASYQKARNSSDLAEIIFGSPFDYTFISSQVTVGKRLNQFNSVSLIAGFNYIEAPKYLKNISASNSRIDKAVSLAASYAFDSRDLAQFPLKGFFIRTYLQNKGFGINSFNYQVANLDFRNYLNLIDDLYFKYRLASRLTFGEDVPFYDYSFIGLGERIRGHFNAKREGHNSYLASIETYFPLIKEWIVNLDFIPLLPKELLKFRLALYAQAFADAGATRFHNEKITFKNFDLGYGIGITLLLLPHNSLRFELAYDDHGNKEWIFDLGTAF